MITAAAKSTKQPNKASMKIDSCYFPPPHLIAPEAKNFSHHKRVGDYFLGEVLGEGSFAKTRLGAHVFSGEKVSIYILGFSHSAKNTKTRSFLTFFPSNSRSPSKPSTKKKPKKINTSTKTSAGKVKSSAKSITLISFVY